MKKITIIIEDDGSGPVTPTYPQPVYPMPIPEYPSPYPPYPQVERWWIDDKTDWKAPQVTCLHQKLDQEAIKAGKLPPVTRMLSCPCPRCSPRM